jgi:hypothetical protein
VSLLAFTPFAINTNVRKLFITRGRAKASAATNAGRGPSRWARPAGPSDVASVSVVVGLERPVDGDA